MPFFVIIPSFFVLVLHCATLVSYIYLFTSALDPLSQILSHLMERIALHMHHNGTQ